MKEKWMNQIVLNTKELTEEQALYYSYFLLSQIDHRNYEDIKVYFLSSTTFKVIEKNQNGISNVFYGTILDEKTALTFFVKRKTTKICYIFKIFKGDIVKMKIENNKIFPEVFLSNVKLRTLQEYVLDYFMKEENQRVKMYAI